MTREITISQFKAHCLEIINKLQNNESIIITRRHKAVARVESINSSSKTCIFGMLKDKAKIKDDIIKPINEKWSCE